jgi:hypothetical protein
MLNLFIYSSLYNNSSGKFLLYSSQQYVPLSHCRIFFVLISISHAYLLLIRDLTSFADII